MTDFAFSLECDFDNQLHSNRVAKIINELHQLIDTRFNGTEKETLFYMEDILRNNFLSLTALAEGEEIDKNTIIEKSSEVELSIQAIEDYLESLIL